MTVIHTYMHQSSIIYHLDTT